jgi:hypothetical protein
VNGFALRMSIRSAQRDPDRAEVPPIPPLMFLSVARQPKGTGNHRRIPLSCSLMLYDDQKEQEKREA